MLANIYLLIILTPIKFDHKIAASYKDKLYNLILKLSRYTNMLFNGIITTEKKEWQIDKVSILGKLNLI